MRIDAKHKYYQQLNKEIKRSRDNEITLDNVLGQRYIGTGVNGKDILINGTPGNALGAYLSGTNITVYGNVQDAVGDTMDSGDIVVHGSGGDTVGYGMRGGSIFIRGHAGYRIGIHMKAYLDKQPVIVVGGSAGSFLGEYQAGGTIIVLGLDRESGVPAGGYIGTGMHGTATMYLRCNEKPAVNDFLDVEKCSEDELKLILPELENYCDLFDADLRTILAKPFWKVSPGTQDPFAGLYTAY